MKFLERKAKCVYAFLGSERLVRGFPSSLSSSDELSSSDDFSSLSSSDPDPTVAIFSSSG
jgi:hypothetical protein